MAQSTRCFWKKACRLCFAIFLAMAVLSLVFLVTGLIVTEVTEVQVVETEISTTLVPREVRVVQITDLHSHHRWHEVIEAVRVASPDIIALTGDFWDDGYGSNQETKSFLTAVEALAVPAFFIQGNNEKDFECPWFVDWMEQNCPSIMFIDGKTVNLTHLGVTVSGSDWDSYDQKYRLSERDFNILLAHAPWRGDRLLRLNPAVNLVLTGHLHNGQINWPVGQPIFTATEAGVQLAGDGAHVSGLKILQSKQMLYVCKGCGGGRPLPRIFNPLAISLIRLVPVD